MSRRSAALLAVLVAALMIPAAASASYLVTRDATDVTLQVDGTGRAAVSYVSWKGSRKHVLVWGAMNALPPTSGARQLEFTVDYSGGLSTYKWPVWKTFRDRCAPYDGPELAWLVAACKAPDGTYWALQAWQRTRPFHGKPPSKPFHDSWELRISHWTGELARIEVWQDWKYSARFESLFGRYTYRGVPVYNPPKGTPGWQSHVRRAYIDTLDSGYGTGWWRADALATHRPTGVFCAIFAVELTDRYGTNRGAGERYRVTMPGPGVTPDVYWEGESLGPWDPSDLTKVRHEQAMNEVIRQLGDQDPRCAEL